MSRPLSARRQKAEAEAAEDYAWSIREGINRDWTAYNAVLIDQFSLAGLRRIKVQAWKLLDRGAVR